MQPQTFIFIGRSGCGKGTQAKLLIDYLKSNSSNPVFYLESGEKFREFISSSSYTAKLAREIAQKGGLQPAFLAIHIWSHLMIEQMEAEKHVVIDGSPRKLDEAKILGEALAFYNRKPTVIYMNVSRIWAEDKLVKRGRADDKTKEEIKKRLDWFETDVAPTISYLKESPFYNFIEINGEPSIEEVHAQILSKLGWQ